MRFTVVLFMAAAVLALPAPADVTITSTTSGKAAMFDAGGESTTRIKGNKMRMDQTSGDDTLATIIDIDGQQMISLNFKKKEASVMPLATLQQAVGKLAEADVKAEITPTSETKQVAGYACKVHQMHIAVPFNPAGPGGDASMTMTMLLDGPACLSQEAPGYADYSRLYKTAAEKGFIFGDPRQAKGPAASQAKALASLYKTMAQAGVALEHQLNLSLEGSGPMAAIMGKAIKSNFTTTVTKIEAGALGAEIFDIPAGFKVKTEK